MMQCAMDATETVDPIPPPPPPPGRGTPLIQNFSPLGIWVDGWITAEIGKLVTDKAQHFHVLELASCRPDARKAKKAVSLGAPPGT